MSRSAADHNVNKVDQNSDFVQTLQTTAATIKFTGGVLNSEDSDSEEEVQHGEVQSAKTGSRSQQGNESHDRQGNDLNSFPQNETNKTLCDIGQYNGLDNFSGAKTNGSRPTSTFCDTPVNGQRTDEELGITNSEQSTDDASQRPRTAGKLEQKQSEVKTGNQDTKMSPVRENSGERMSLSDSNNTQVRRNSDRFNPFDRDKDFNSEQPDLQHACDSKTDRGTATMDSIHYPDDRVHHLSISSCDSDWTVGSPSDSHDTELDMTINAELGLAEDHFALPEGHFGLTGVEEMEMAINNCKLLILQTPEHTERRHNLVNKLVQLRMKLSEAKEGPPEEEPDVKSVVGHKFMKKNSRSSKHYCEKCNSLIWGMIQTWYRCRGCGFSCHAKCLNLITRTCASAKVAENANYILSICPEKGLAAQNYRCAECRTPLSYKNGFGEPRQCDYTGSYYCELCHWNDTMIIPARVLHNWDMEPKKVCRASRQFLRLMMTKAVIRIQDINPMLFSFVEELNEVKKLREEILIMKKYFLSCQAALESKLLLQLQDRQHFVENSDMYSLQDLLDVASDTLLPHIAKIHTSFAQHVKTDCKLCQAKGYICELCEEQEVLFPFDNIAIVCSQCSTVLHRHCYTRRNRHCPKCERLNRRSTELSDQHTIDT